MYIKQGLVDSMTKKGWDSIVRALKILDRDRDIARLRRIKQERGGGGGATRLGE